MSNIKELLQQYEQVNAELNKQIQENGKEFISSVFQEVFDNNPGLKFVYILGWTPGFNDGEPCTHSQETFVGSSYYATWREKDYYDFEEREMYEEFDTDEDNPANHINKECKTLDSVASQLAVYDEIIERVFDTNFELKISLDKNGKVQVDQDYYDCGY